MKRQGMNPYLPGWEYIPDGEPRLFEGRVYLYGSHDEARGKTYCTGDYVCWSAPQEDLTSWTFEGVIFRTADDPTYQGQSVLYFAPDATQGPDGRYYLYYFSSKMDKIGVAVCDTPAGHYRYLGDVRFEDGSILTADSGYGLPFDPGILSDESGNWLYYGFALQKRMEGFPEAGYLGGYVTQLKDDMLTIFSQPLRTIPGKLEAGGTEFEDHAFLEASSIRHYGKWFYLVYSSELGHELCYARSEYPDHGFTYQGTLISNGDVGLNGRTEEEAVGYLANNHGGLVEILGQYYMFYHRHTHGIQYSRQACAERIIMDDAGKFAQVEITSQGLNAGPLRARGEYSAHTACALRSGDGILHYSSSVHWNEAHPYISQEDETGAATLQNQYIYNLRNNASCGFKYFTFEGSEKTVEIRYRGTFSGSVEVSIEHRNSPSAVIRCEETAEWKWTAADLSVQAGTYAIYFKCIGSGSLDLDAFAIR